MQTFLPFESFISSAACLDRSRLGKQRVENLQIMRAILNPVHGWQNHPAVKMWRGHEGTLMLYQMAICHEWSMMRRYTDTCLEKTLAVWEAYGSPEGTFPPWLGDKDFHRSHQSNLLRKDPEHYGPLFPDVPDDLPYVWPISTEPEEPYEGVDRDARDDR